MKNQTFAVRQGVRDYRYRSIFTRGIRKCALGQSVRSAPNKYLKQAFQSICQINDSRLDKIKELLLNACYGDDG